MSSKRHFLLIFLLLVVAILFSLKGQCQKEQSVELLYHSLEADGEKPQFDVFQKAITGYGKLKERGLLSENNLLTIIDLSISANEKRMWLIDIEQKKILQHILVSHGKNTGGKFASNFSNTPQSLKSSLGFYITGKTYYGKHGYSLYLDGMEKGFNDNARKRSIVIHGAEYVSKKFIKKHGRLGRSFGCPAISMSKYEEVIKLIANKTCLFIYYPDKKYINNSKLIKPNV